MTEGVGCPACGAVVSGRRLSCPACGAILAAVRGRGLPADVGSGGVASAASRGGAHSGQGEAGASGEVEASAEVSASAEVNAPAAAGVAAPEPASAAETGRPLPAEDRAGEGEVETAALRSTGHPGPSAALGVTSTSALEGEAVLTQSPGPALVPETEPGPAPAVTPTPPPTVAPGPAPRATASGAPGAAGGPVGPPPILRDWVGPEPSAAAAADRPGIDLPPQGRPGPVPGAYLPPSAVYLPSMSEPWAAAASPRLGSPERRAWATPAAAGPTAAVGEAMPSMPDVSAPAATRPAGSAPTAPGTRTTGELPSALTLRTIGGAMASWLVVAGSVLGVVAFLLPWSPNGVIGSPGDPGYLGRWGLANGAYLLVMAAAFGCLAVQLLETRLPALLRDVVLPLALGGFLLGLGWTYVAGPFGADLGVQAVLLGGLLLVVGGGLALRVPTSRNAGPPAS